MNMKHWIIPIARATGLISLTLFLFRKRIPILMLHGVMDSADKSSWQPSWTRNSCSELEDALKRLDNKFHFVSMEYAAKMIAGTSPLKPYTIVLTFDDGYSNNVSHAWPILRKYNAEMTIYIATSYVKERRAFWIDNIDYALHCLLGKSDVEVSILDRSFVFDLSTTDSYSESYTKFRKMVKSLSFNDDYEMLAALDDVANQLESSSGRSLSQIIEDDPWSRPLKMDELKGLDSGIHIGAHTVNHIRATHVGKTQLNEELRVSKTELEQSTGLECVHFCYPNGDCDESSAQAVKEAGYQSAVSCNIGTNLLGSDLFTLKRFAFPTLKDPQDIDFWLAMQFIKEYFSRL